MQNIWFKKAKQNKTKNLCSSKDNIKKKKKQITGWEKILATHVSDGGLTSSRISNNSCNSVMKRQPNWKSDQKAWIGTSQRKIYKWPVNTRGCSMSVVIGEMQIKTKMIPTNGKKERKPWPHEGAERLELSFVSSRRMKWSDHFVNQSGRFS